MTWIVPQFELRGTAVVNASTVLHKPVATLGPVGTDAHAIAVTLSKDIVYCDSFLEAVAYAHQNNTYALVACGYKQIENGRIVDTWVDLSFRYTDKMKIVRTFCAEVKPMCVAKRMDVDVPQTLVIHPATETFSNLLEYPPQISYVNAKPKAVKLAAEGTFDTCIGSKDEIAKYDNLTILYSFKPQMAWALYEQA